MSTPTSTSTLNPNVRPVKSRSWRWRRCPACRAVNGASRFTIVGRYRPGWTDNANLERRCPSCGLTAPTFKFAVVREQRAVAG